ncbi:uncharacterized protein LOC125419156 [Ziziphus jujuba]|uniref:Uncharacterized protein LOC125419156 n=2 Tax=Ziziphus jujuba TaxID=326968 RepID=A0ABM3I4K2_ZIZJJ|nr:uncharacterized protein LOC125419156 [Ziziphus jujuba]KAH7544665.1 hypothetical protein FEM48_Zijuj01G0009900 [Ziziphus jujuba var. spinosa]
MERERLRSSEKIISVFQANEFFVKKILSRNSSVGQQSSRYHCRRPGVVPFKWELRPGKPKDPPAKEYIPVIGPPPAILSQALSRPHHHHHDVPASPPAKKTRLLFWKRSKKNNKKVKKIGSFRISENINIEDNNGFDEKFGLANYKAPADDQEFLSSSCDSTTSTSSTSSTASSSSSSYAHIVHHSKFHSLAKGLLRWPF